MEKRASVRAYYDNKANKVIEDKKYESRTAQLDALESTIITAFNNLLKYMDGKTTKTEVVNQLKEISTPDILKLLPLLDKLDQSIIGAKVDQKPLLDALNSLKREVTLVPAKMPKPLEQKSEIKVSNLKEIVFDTTDLEKAINSLDLKVDAPIINTEKTDLEPLRKIMLELLKSHEKMAKMKPMDTMKVSNLSEIKPTDLTEVEKKLAEANKHLKAISEKRTGGGGGGGNGTPYTDSTGKPMNVILTASGQIPVDVDMATEGIATEATLAKLNGFSLPVYDAIIPTFNATSDVWVYKTGGAGGATVATITISYTDATKATISSIVRS